MIVERKKTLTLDSNFNKELCSNGRNTLQLLPLYQGTTETDKKRLISKKILNHIFKESQKHNDKKVSTVKRSTDTKKPSSKRGSAVK